MSYDIKHPYLLFLGDAPDFLAAKTANGIAHWRRDWCVGQYRMPGCKADLGLPDMSLREGIAAGARTLVIGVANRGGKIGPEWQEILFNALEMGLDIASGLHNKVADVPALAKAAKHLDRHIFDVRHPPADLPVGTGVRRSGRRLLTVGTDCSVGKMFTSLALEKEMTARGMNATFRATGQTGIFIAGSGISVDAVVADFISGCIEQLTPDNEPDHWDLVEGQGSLFHASFAGVSMGLLHGAQPDAMVLCHEPGRPHMRGLPGYTLPDIAETIALNERCARLTNPAAKVIGIACNTANLSEAEAMSALAALEKEHGLPAVDPVRHGVAKLVDALPA